MPVKPVASRITVLSMLASLMTAPVNADTAITRASMLANSCAACHGPDGRSPGSIPSIAGKSAEFIAEAMFAFRDGSKPATVMDRHAKGYSDEDIRLLADYFSKQ